MVGPPDGTSLHGTSLRRAAAMSTLDRRDFLKAAAALGATLAWGCSPVRPSSSGWRERRDLYPQGVASGDPDAASVLLWTRRPYADGRDRATLLVEVAEDPSFARVTPTARPPELEEAPEDEDVDVDEDAAVEGDPGDPGDSGHSDGDLDETADDVAGDPRP